MSKHAKTPRVNIWWMVEVVSRCDLQQSVWFAPGNVNMVAYGKINTRLTPKRFCHGMAMGDNLW